MPPIVSGLSAPFWAGLAFVEEFEERRDLIDAAQHDKGAVLAIRHSSILPWARVPTLLRG